MNCLAEGVVGSDGALGQGLSTDGAGVVVGQPRQQSSSLVGVAFTIEDWIEHDFSGDGTLKGLWNVVVAVVFCHWLDQLKTSALAPIYKFYIGTLLLLLLLLLFSILHDTGLRVRCYDLQSPPFLDVVMEGNRISRGR